MLNATAVLDTNLVVSAQMATIGNPVQIIDAWHRGEFSLVTSPELVAELAEVLTRPRLQQRYHSDEATRLRLVADFRRYLAQPLPLADLPIRCRDPKDDKVLACALGAVADYIVTGDKDLLDLDGEPALGGPRIVTPEQFLAILREGSLH